MTFKSLFVLALATAAVRVSGSKLRFAGVNMAGFDFGCYTDGHCDASQAHPPLTELGGPDGQGQMEHFVKDDGYNIFRLPVGWQYLTNGKPTGTLDVFQFANYNKLVFACLRTGAHCQIDIHNYARYDGQIIGQGGPSNQVFADLWRNIADHWKGESRILFGIMNEPHDIPDVGTWAQTVQAAVTAIRSTGATSQIILLPGNGYTSAGTIISDGSAAALNAVKNPDGGTTNLVFDVHKYLDSDNSGTNQACVTDNVDSAWKPLAAWLRQNGRQALNTETGGGNDDSCVQYLSQQIAFQAANSDVILGYIGWAAGSFDSSYVLSETPTKNGNSWTDAKTVSAVLSPKKNSLIA